MATRKPTALPGGSSDDGAPQDVTKPIAEDTRSLAMGLPDFREKSVDYAIRWFKDNPTAPRRNVQTAEGWYVHPESVTARADLAGR